MFSKKQKIPEVVITQLPRWSNFQWFLLGFYKLRQNGVISLSFHVDFASRLSTMIENRYLLGFFKRIFPISDSYNLKGYIRINEEKKFFCIDSADSPFLFDSKLLDNVCVYFKMQCPNVIDSDGFPLTNSIVIPWCDHRHINPKLKYLTDRGARKKCNNLLENCYKVKPLMVGPRRLAFGNSYRALRKAFNLYLSSSENCAEKKLMCYFGNALGPMASVSVVEPDYDNESDLLACFSGKISHPNEKRALVAKMMSSYGNQYDDRVIDSGNADEGTSNIHKELVVPLNVFCSHISMFEYNLNISGYRMSIPNRFIESFMAGTAILTDKLKVKWYLPFNEEVRESVDMGYLPGADIEWKQIEEDLLTLPTVSKKQILKEFSQKWAPEVVAEYIVQSVCCGTDINNFS